MADILYTFEGPTCCNLRESFFLIFFYSNRKEQEEKWVCFSTNYWNVNSISSGDKCSDKNLMSWISSVVPITRIVVANNFDSFHFILSLSCSLIHHFEAKIWALQPS